MIKTCRCGARATHQVVTTGHYVCQQHKPDGFVCIRITKPKTK